jgi:glycosyltransferase involved in cell wall biosynthesis
MRAAIVVQRYGEEVNGGAELHARTIAELLHGEVEVTVLTTCALDYRTWADHYPAGETRVGPVRVLRFPVDAPRDEARFDALSLRVLGGAERGPEAEERWMAEQGPRCRGIAEHLAVEPGRYDVVVVFTYLYAHALAALEAARAPCILVPELHDDPPLHLGIYDRVFALPRLLLPNTPEERDLMERRFGLARAASRVVGLGVDPPPPGTDGERFRRAHGITRPYALCLGRIDPSKGSGELVAHHARYRALEPRGLDLVMLGRSVMELPTHPWLHAPGYVDDAAKWDALDGAACLVAPSRYESLSIAMLEAWSSGVPTLANGDTPVLVGQSRRAGGGLWYRDAEEYAVGAALLGGRPPLAAALGAQGRRYVRSRLSWERVRALWTAALRDVSAGGGQGADGVAKARADG